MSTIRVQPARIQAVNRVTLLSKRDLATIVSSGMVACLLVAVSSDPCKSMAANVKRNGGGSKAYYDTSSTQST